MLWSLMRRGPTVPVPSVLLSPLWLAELMGLDVIRDRGTESTWLLEPVELVELLATHAGEEYASPTNWLNVALLSPAAVGLRLGDAPSLGRQPLRELIAHLVPAMPPALTCLLNTCVTAANQVLLWREIVWW